jgi:hypothetical protein
MACFASKVTDMLRIRKSSELNRSAFDMMVEILRELQEPTGIAGIKPHCNVDFKKSGCRLGFMNSSDLIQTDAVMAVAIESYEDMYLENRKKRPQERGRKKRRKGKWNPIDRLWNSASPKGCSSTHLLEED